MICNNWWLVRVTLMIDLVFLPQIFWAGGGDLRRPYAILWMYIGCWFYLQVVGTPKYYMWYSYFFYSEVVGTLKPSITYPSPPSPRYAVQGVFGVSTTCLRSQGVQGWGRRGVCCTRCFYGPTTCLRPQGVQGSRRGEGGQGVCCTRCLGYPPNAWGPRWSRSRGRGGQTSHLVKLSLPDYFTYKLVLQRMNWYDYRVRGISSCGILSKSIHKWALEIYCVGRSLK